MFMLPLNIIVLLFEITLSYNVGLIEYLFIEIASIKTHQHIGLCASMLTLLV